MTIPQNGEWSWAAAATKYRVSKTSFYRNTDSLLGTRKPLFGQSCWGDQNVEILFVETLASFFERDKDLIASLEITRIVVGKKSHWKHVYGSKTEKNRVHESRKGHCAYRIKVEIRC